MHTIHKIHYYLQKNFLFNTNIFDSIIKKNFFFFLKTISSLNNSLVNRSLFSSLFLLLNDIFMINNNFLSRLSAIMNAISRMLRMRTENNFFLNYKIKAQNNNTYFFSLSNLNIFLFFLWYKFRSELIFQSRKALFSSKAPYFLSNT